MIYIINLVKMDLALTKVYQEGEGGLPVFAGSYRQGGAGFLANLFKVALPFLKTAGKHAVNVASATAHDVLDEKSTLGDALIKNSLREVGQVFPTTRKRPLLRQLITHKQNAKRRRLKQ